MMHNLCPPEVLCPQCDVHSRPCAPVLPRLVLVIGGGEPAHLTAVVHRRAEKGGGQGLLPSPFLPFSVCARSLFEVPRGNGGSEAASSNA